MISVHIYDIQSRQKKCPNPKIAKRQMPSRTTTNAELPKVSPSMCAPTSETWAAWPARYPLRSGSISTGDCPSIHPCKPCKPPCFHRGCNKNRVLLCQLAYSKKKQLAHKKSTSNSVPYHPCMVYLPKFG